MSRDVKKRQKSSSALYCPQVTRLKTHFDSEFRRFLKSLKRTTDALECNQNSVLLNLEKQIRGSNKRTSKLNLLCKSMRDWKLFFSEFISRCDDIIGVFRFDNIEPVEIAMEKLNISPSLRNYIEGCLFEWRKLFIDKNWMFKYTNLTKSKINLEKEILEYRDKRTTSISILDEFEKYDVDINEMLQIPKENLENWIKNRIKQAKIEMKIRETSSLLNRLPSSSRKFSTREWCMKHYDSNLQPLSDDDFSIEERSSLFGEGDDSPSDISTSSSTSENQQIESIDSFFSSKGL